MFTCFHSLSFIITDSKRFSMFCFMVLSDAKFQQMIVHGLAIFLRLLKCRRHADWAHQAHKHVKSGYKHLVLDLQIYYWAASNMKSLREQHKLGWGHVW